MVHMTVLGFILLLIPSEIFAKGTVTLDSLTFDKVSEVLFIISKKKEKKKSIIERKIYESIYG